MFYNKFFSSSFEELITYYPKFYRDVLEMRAILEAQGRLADGLEDSIEQVFANCFIDTADETTIRKLEEFLHLGLYKERSLEERRRLVKSLFVGSGKTSADMISEMIAAYTGARVTCAFEPFDEAGNNKLYIDFDRGTEKTLYMSDILSLIESRIPAHLAYRIAVCYTASIAINSEIFIGNNYYPLCGTRFAGQEGAL